MSRRRVNWNLNFRQRSYQSYQVAMSSECHIMAPPDHWHTRVLDTDQCQARVNIIPTAQGG